MALGLLLLLVLNLCSHLAASQLSLKGLKATNGTVVQVYCTKWHNSL